MRKPRKQKKRLIKNKKVRFYLKVFGVTCSVLGSLALVFAFAVIFGVINVTKGLTIGKLSLKYNSFIYAYDSKGNEKIYETINGGANRVWTEITEMPPNLKNAIVAIEDERFYKHKGFDFKSTTKAGVDYILKRPGGRGASTLTQQLIKNVTGDDDVSISRKGKEILQALQLERKMSKEQILEMYLNTIYLSNGCNGVKTASDLFFAKDVSELNLDECALLVGITQYPSKYDPFRHYDAAMEKRNTVLAKMKQLGYISVKEYDKAIDTKTKIATKNKDVNIQSYYADQVITDVIRDLKEINGYTEDKAASLVYNGGLKIYAAVDPDIQKIADSVYTNSANFPKFYAKVQPNSAIAIMDQYTGQVKALVGGRGKKKASLTLNRATQSLRQPGSSFKPIAAYGAAVENGRITPNTVISGAGYSKGSWHVAGSGGNTTVANAITRSLNTVAIRTVEMTGIEKSYAFAEKLGISTLVPADKNLASLALGGLTRGVSPLEMAAAYSCYPNDGVYNKPITYTKVLNPDGDVVLENKPSGDTVMKKRTAQTMVGLLKGPVRGGTATGARFSGSYDICGKTGTTNENKDRWFVGFTPYYTAAIWFGCDQPKDLRMPMLTNPCLKVFSRIMSQVHSKLRLPARRFNTPSSLEAKPEPTETPKPTKAVTTPMPTSTEPSGPATPIAPSSPTPSTTP